MSVEYMGDAGAVLNTIDSIGSSPALEWAGIATSALGSISGIVQGVQKLKALRQNLAAQKDNLQAMIKIKEIDREIAQLAVEAARLGYANASSLASGQSANVGTSSTAKTLALGGGAAALALMLMSK